MSSNAGGSLGEHFGNMEDPRRDQGKRHQLLDIIAMTIRAVIGGAEGWSDVELLVQCKYEWFQRFLDLPNGVPCPDTFARVFARIDPEQFRNCFMDWVSSVNRLTQDQVVAVDGKTLRRSHDRNSGKEAIHMVSAWASENSLVLGQTKVEAKSNEITAIPELLNLLDMSGCIVTIDAMGCQKKIARQIVSQEADYVLAVKENQGRPLEDVEDLFSCGQRTGFEDMKHDFCQTLDKRHGRIETRRCWTIDDPEQLSSVETGKFWPGLRSIGMVTAERRQRDRVIGGIPVPHMRFRVGRQGTSPSNSKPLGNRESGPLGAGLVLPGRRKPGAEQHGRIKRSPLKATNLDVPGKRVLFDKWHEPATVQNHLADWMRLNPRGSELPMGEVVSLFTGPFLNSHCSIENCFNKDSAGPYMHNIANDTRWTVHHHE